MDIFLVVISLGVLAIVGCKAAYYNGVNDGYMYSKEPWNPGYEDAGNHLIRIGKANAPPSR
jgi:hypothetical protein